MSTEVDPWWALLVGVLESCGLVEQREPYGLTVSRQRPDGTPTVVEIVMTQEQWDDLVSISWGVVATAAQHVRGLVVDQSRGQRYLVYNEYTLVPCDTPELPVDPDFLRVQELAKQGPDGIIRGGGWYAHKPDGN